MILCPHKGLIGLLKALGEGMFRRQMIVRRYHQHFPGHAQIAADILIYLDAVKGKRTSVIIYQYRQLFRRDLITFFWRLVDSHPERTISEITEDILRHNTHDLRINVASLISRCHRSQRFIITLLSPQFFMRHIHHLRGHDLYLRRHPAILRLQIFPVHFHTSSSPFVFLTHVCYAFFLAAAQ